MTDNVTPARRVRFPGPRDRMKTRNLVLKKKTNSLAGIPALGPMRAAKSDGGIAIAVVGVLAGGCAGETLAVRFVKIKIPKTPAAMKSTVSSFLTITVTAKAMIATASAIKFRPIVLTPRFQHALTMIALITGPMP